MQNKTALLLVGLVVILVIAASFVGDKHSSHYGIQYQKIMTGK